MVTLSLFKNIYNKKNVLVTGHNGFKGSWLSLWLEQLGANVYGFSLIPDSLNHYSLLNLKVDSTIGDVREKIALERCVKKAKPEIIFHLAAQPYVIDSYLDPEKTFQTNVMGTLNLLEIVKKHKNIKALIIITTDKVYENIEKDVEYTESFSLGGYDPYSASKACCELLINSYRNSFFNINGFLKTHQTIISSVRAGNVIGGGDWGANRLIPDIVKNASKKNITTIRNPNSIRPWQHVFEALSGYLMLGEKLLLKKINYSGAWNFGPHDDALKVSELVSKMQQYWCEIKVQEEKNKEEFHEAKILKLNSNKARQILKWQPLWDNEKTLEKTTEWYKLFYEKSQVISLQQLNEYVKKAIKENLVWTR